MTLNKDKIGWLSVVVITAIILLIPTNEVFTSSIKVFSAITLAMILIFAFELMDIFVPSLLLPCLYAFFKVAPTTVVFSPWLQELPWTIMGVLLFINVAERTGLLKRISFWVILKIGSTYNRILIGLTIAGIVVTFLVPGTALYVLVPLGYGICQSLNLGKSNTATGIMLTAGIASATPTFWTYSPSYFGITLASAQATVPELSVSYLGFLMHNGIYVFYLFIIVFVISKMFKEDAKILGKEYFQQEYEALGKVSLDEKKLAGIAVALLIYLCTSSLHNMGIGWGFVFTGCLCYAPGINVGKSEDIQRINLGLVCFVTSCLAIGVTATSIGIGQIMVDYLVPFLEGKSTTAFLFVLFVVVFIMNFLMTPAAITAICSGLFAQLAIDIGINPLPVIYFMAQSSDQVLLAYEYVHYLFVFSFGVISTKNFVKTFTVKTIIWLVFAFVVVVPYWKLIGLL